MTRVLAPDSVRGRGSRRLFGGSTSGLVVVEVDAISAPAGEDPAGTFSTQYGSGPAAGADIRGRVVCLTVVGNRASVGGIVEQSNSSTNPVGSGVWLAFTDNGDPGAGRDTQLSYLNRSDAETCSVPLFPEAGPEIVLDDGDFSIVDTQP